MFRQAMRTPVISFHVVPSSVKLDYEQLHQAERSPASGHGDQRDHAPPHRVSRHGSQTRPHHHHPPPDPDGYPPLPHPAAAKPPTGHTPSPQRAQTATPTGGYGKKVGRRLNIQLKKGERRRGAGLKHER